MSPTPMSLQEVILALQELEQQGLGGPVHLPVKTLGATVGGTPTVAITDVRVGFDWDHGKILLGTTLPVAQHDPKEQKAYQTLENSMGMLLLGLQRVLRSDLFPPEEKIKQIEDILARHIARPNLKAPNPKSTSKSGGP